MAIGNGCVYHRKAHSRQGHGHVAAGMAGGAGTLGVIPRLIVLVVFPPVILVFGGGTLNARLNVASANTARPAADHCDQDQQCD